MKALIADSRILFLESAFECNLKGFSNEVVGIIVRSGIQIDKNFLNIFPRLRFVIRAGSGLDNIDLIELKERDIKLFRNPKLSASAVAELAFASLILLARRVPEAASLLYQGVWSKSTLIGESITNLTVAIWGGGSIGNACAQLMMPICQELFFAQWHSLPDEYPQLSPKQLVSKADVHVLCLPLRKQTTNLFDKDFFEKAKSKRPYILNVGRFGLIDFKEAILALERRDLRGIFVDPIEQSDIKDVLQIIQNKSQLNLLLSQHLGAQRRDVLEQIGEWVIQILDEVSDQ